MGRTAEDTSRLQELIEEAEDCRATFGKIFREYPSSEVNVRPTSMSWRPPAGAAISEPDIAAGVDAHKQLRQHLQRVERYFADLREAPEKWERFPLKPYLFPYWTPGMQNESQHSWRLALEDHCERLRMELSKLAPSKSKAEPRGVLVPAGFPQRLEAAKGRRSWNQLAGVLGMDSKTLRKLHTQNARVDQSSFDTALEFVEKTEASLKHPVVTTDPGSAVPAPPNSRSGQLRRC